MHPYRKEKVGYEDLLQNKNWRLTTYRGSNRQYFSSSGAICYPWGPWRCTSITCRNDTAKLQLFHKPARGWRKFYCNEMSLVGCFTRITVNVPRIVINWFWGIVSWCGWLQQPCHPHAGMCGGMGSMAAAVSSIIIWKTDIAYRGEVGSSFDSVESSISGLCPHCRFVSLQSTKQSRICLSLKKFPIFVPSIQ